MKKPIHYFLGHATTQFMGMEWSQDFVITGASLPQAERRAGKTDWTHGDGIEQLEDISLREIPKEHYDTLKLYLLDGDDLSK